MNKMKRLLALNPDEMNILVAEKLGWESNSNGAWHRGDEVVTLHGSCSDGCGGIGSDFDAMTNYQGDLNACAEMEKSIPLVKIERYWTALVELCAHPRLALRGLQHGAIAISATARQRCIAFLLVMENK